MATQPEALLVCLTSPYGRRGEVWKAYRDHFGRDRDEVLVVKADTRTMNQTVPAGEIERAYTEDPMRAAAEYGAEFRTDVETYVSEDVLEAVTVPDRHEVPPAVGLAYVGFVDPSGGGADSFTLAIAHRAGERLVLDLVREVRPPFSPEQVVEDFSETARRYRVAQLVGDHYAGEWPREQFRKHDLTYAPSARPKSDLYRDLLPLLNSGRIELLDLPRLRAQFRLERRTGRGGRDVIDHAPGGHDDLANAAAGALLLAASRGTGMTEADVARLHAINDRATGGNPLSLHVVL